MAAIMARFWPPVCAGFSLCLEILPTERFANCVADPSQMYEQILIPAVVDDVSISVASENPATSGQVVHAWNLARKAYDVQEKTKPNQMKLRLSAVLPLGDVCIFPRPPTGI